MPDDESQESTSGILFVQKIESGKQELRKQGSASESGLAYTLFLNSRNVSGGKLPTAIALDQCVCELHDSIERLAVRFSFYARFSENNCHVIAVKAR